MDCLYFAFRDAHINKTGLRPRSSTWILYKTMKIATHGLAPQMTYGGVAPWMLHRMAEYNGLGIEGCYKYFGVPEYLALSKKDYPFFYEIHRLVIKQKYLGLPYNRFMSRYVNVINVPSPIRLNEWVHIRGDSIGGIWLQAGHALFSQTRPNGLIYGFYRLTK